MFFDRFDCCFIEIWFHEGNTSLFEYLTLNDAIKAFSDRILPLLIANRTRLQLSDPSLSLIDLIRRKNHSTEILSLIMKTHAFWASTSLDWLIEFPNLISLTLLQCYHAGQISMYTEYLPHLIRLSLSNDNQFNFHIIIDVLKSLKVAIQRLEIHSYAHVNIFSRKTRLICVRNALERTRLQWNIPRV